MPLTGIIPLQEAKGRVRVTDEADPYVLRHMCESYENDDHVLVVKERQLIREMIASTNDDHKEEMRKHITEIGKQKTALATRRAENSKLHFSNEIAFAYLDGLRVVYQDYYGGEDGDLEDIQLPITNAEISAKALIEHAFSYRLSAQHDAPINYKERYAKNLIQKLKDDAKLETWDGTGTRDTAPDVKRAIPYNFFVVNSFSEGATAEDVTRGYRLVGYREVLVSHVFRNVQRPGVEGPI